MVRYYGNTLQEAYGAYLCGRQKDYDSMRQIDKLETDLKKYIDDKIQMGYKTNAQEAAKEFEKAFSSVFR